VAGWWLLEVHVEIMASCLANRHSQESVATAGAMQGAPRLPLLLEMVLFSPF